jgi:hypothetical protein
LAICQRWPFSSARTARPAQPVKFPAIPLSTVAFVDLGVRREQPLRPRAQPGLRLPLPAPSRTPPPPPGLPSAPAPPPRTPPPAPAPRASRAHANAPPFPPPAAPPFHRSTAGLPAPPASDFPARAAVSIRPALSPHRLNSVRP